MKKTTIILLSILTIVIANPANAQIGNLKNKAKEYKKGNLGKESSAQTNAKNKAVVNRKAKAEWFTPSVEPITDPKKITPEYVKKVTKIYSEWLDGTHLGNDERRHIANVIKRMGIIAQKAIDTRPFGGIANNASFICKDVEVIRYESINQGKQPSVDGNEYHVEGFKVNYYCPNDIYNTPLHEKMREWFPVMEAIRDWYLANNGWEWAYVKVDEEYGGNMLMCKDKDGKIDRVKNFK